MSAQEVRKYLTQDLSVEEKESYIKYIKGDIEYDDWVEKSLNRRESLLNLRCKICSCYINVYQTGVCLCENNHKCYDVVINNIKILFHKLFLYVFGK